MRPLVVLFSCALFHALSAQLSAQAPVYPEFAEDPEVHQKLIAQGEELVKAGELLGINEAKEQLKRPHCEPCDLPKPATEPRRGREIFEAARKSHLRVGWLYLCKKCDKWHLNLAGGYVIGPQGLAASCEHVLLPDENNMREGYLVAATDDNRMCAVKEILAASKALDAAIFRIADHSLPALALQADVVPGDRVYCFSDPMGQRGYFSQGIINRLYHDKEKKAKGAVRINVGTDWAPGSSGSAVLDEYGNAVGHVSQITPLEQGKGGKLEGKTLMVLHEAVSARDILSLFQTGSEAAAATPSITEDLPLGTTPPEWKLESWQNSEPLTLESLRGKAVLVRWFTGPPCPHCKATAPALNKFHEQFAEKGLQVIGIYHHKGAGAFHLDQLTSSVEDYGFKFPVAYDAEWQTLREWWLAGHDREFTSVTFLLDREGKITHVHPGGTCAEGTDDHAALQAAIEKALGTEPGAK